MVGDEGQGNSNNKECGSYPGTVPDAGNATITCSASAVGRYVSIKRTVHDVLTLCEVEVAATAGDCQGDIPHHSLYLYFFLRTYINTDTNTYTSIYIHTYLVYTHIHTCIHTYIQTYTLIHTYRHTYIHIHILKHIYTYIYTYIHIYMHRETKRD